MVERQSRLISRRNLILAAGLSSLGSSHCSRLLLAGDESSTQVQPHQQYPDRQEFVSRLAQVQDHDRPEDVLKLLGRPDEIRTGPEIAPYVETDQHWCYGSSGAETLATLGTICFRKGKVCWTKGRYGQPPDPALIDELELRAGLKFLGRGSDSPGDNDPLHLIRVTNYLVPLGKEKALAIIGEYGRVHPYINETWLFLLIRILFDVPEPPGHMPEMRIGLKFPSPPKNLMYVPRFPIVMMDDIPFSVLEGVSLFGTPEPISRHVGYFQKHGTLRKQKLHPPDDPYLSLLKLPEFQEVKAIEEEAENRNWKASNNTRLLLHVVTLCRTIDKWPEAQEPRPKHVVSTFDQYHNDFLLAKPKWDEQLQLYVRGDGSHEEFKPYVRRRNK